MRSIHVPLLVLPLLTSCFYRLDQFPVDLKEGDIQVILVGALPGKIGVQPLAGGRVSLARSGVTRTSREDGRVTFRNVPAGNHRLNLIYDPDGDRVPNLAARLDVPIIVRDDGATRPAVDLGRVVLLEPATITGHVDVSANPSLDLATITVALDGFDLQVTPDANGNFTIQGLGAGAWTVAAAGGGLITTPADFSVTPGEQKNVGTLTMRLPAAEPATLSGTITQPPELTLSQGLNNRTGLVVGAGAGGQVLDLGVTSALTFARDVPEGLYTLQFFLDADHRTVIIPGVMARAGQTLSFKIIPGVLGVERDGPCQGKLDLDGDGQCFLDADEPGEQLGCLEECRSRTSNRDAPCTIAGTWDCDDDADSQLDADERNCRCTLGSETMGEECLKNTARLDRQPNTICDSIEPLNPPPVGGSSSSSSSTSSSGGGSSSSAELASSSSEGTSSSGGSTTGCRVLESDPGAPVVIPWGTSHCFELPLVTTSVTWRAVTAPDDQGTTVDVALNPQLAATPVTGTGGRVRRDNGPIAFMALQLDGTMHITGSVSPAPFTLEAITPEGTFRSNISVIPSLWDVGRVVTQVSAGVDHSLMLVRDVNSGVEELWVSGTFGPATNRVRYDRAVPVQGLLGEGVLHNVLMMKACNSFALVVLGDEQLYEIGVQDAAPRLVLDALGLPITTVRELACGDAHSLVLLMNGRVLAWGSNSHGQIAAPLNVGSSTVANEVEGPWNMGAPVLSVTAGGDNSGLVVADGTLEAYVWGSAQWGVVLTTDQSTPQRLILSAAGAPPPLAQLRLGPTSAFAQLANGGIMGVGTHPAFLGTCTATSETTTAAVTIPSALNCLGAPPPFTDAAELFVGRRHLLIRSVNTPTTVWGVGDNLDGQLGDLQTLFVRTPVVTTIPASGLSAGADHNLWIDPVTSRATGVGSDSQRALAGGEEGLRTVRHPERVRYSLCGNGQHDDAEPCDTTAGSLNCTTECRLEESCGNGVFDGSDLCEEGDQDPDGRCSATCTCNPARSICGDGERVPSCELCDDGNLIAGDGCSATCTVEMGGTTPCQQMVSFTNQAAPHVVQRACLTFEALGTLSPTDNVAYFAVPVESLNALDVEATRHPLRVCDPGANLVLKAFTTAFPTGGVTNSCRTLETGRMDCHEPAADACGTLKLSATPSSRNIRIAVVRPAGVTGAISYRLLMSSY